MPDDRHDDGSFVISRRQVLGGGLAGAAGLVLGSGLPGVTGPSALGAGVASGTPGAPEALRVDNLLAPIGLGLDDVFFSWRVGDHRRGARQRAYRIVVTRVVPAPPGRPARTVWDSGRVASYGQTAVPYGGPRLEPDAVYRWTVQTWGATGAPGPRAAWRTFETGLTDADWRASWVRRPADDQNDTNQYTYVRREFGLRRSPVVRARAYVSADQQYELYVNGVRAGKGQAYSYPDTKYYEALDVTALLGAGRPNAVGLLYNWQGATKGHPAGEPGAIVQISVLHADGTGELVLTDGSWKVRAGAWLPGTQRDLEGDLVDHTENIVGPDEPLGWDRPGFDDAGWAPATVVGPAGTAPWTHLVAVRTRTVESPVRPVSLTRLASGAVVADFGKVSAASPTVRFRQGVAGRTVTMRAGYLLDEPVAGQPFEGTPGQVSTLHGTQHADMSYSYVQRGGVETFSAFDYLGYRYFQIDDPGETLTPGDVLARTRHTAVLDQHAGLFSSSNPTVDAVYELGRHSALFCAQEQFVDTPTREKGPWLWDGCNSSQTAMASVDETNLTRKSLLEFAQSQVRYWPNGAVNKIYPTGLGALDINEFTEIYPEWVWQYWLHAGDLTLLELVYPALVNVARYVHDAIDPSTGLVTSLPATNNYYSFPVVTRMNVLGVNVFRRTAQAAVALGEPAAEVALQRRRQAELTAAVNARLTRDDGTYADGLDATGAQVPSASQDTNACAVAYGVAPAGRVAAVAAYVAGLGLEAPPRTAFEVLEALALAGRTGDVVTRITDRVGSGWANILSQGATFTWEVWQPSDANGDSMSHGWGANVVVAIQRGLLGVRPLGPGYRTFSVAPPLTGLAWASGTVPTPQGTISVRWSAPSDARGAAHLDLVVPPSTTATVTLAASGERALTESGSPVRAATGVRVVSLGGGRAVLAVDAGHYRFASAAPPIS